MDHGQALRSVRDAVAVPAQILRFLTGTVASVDAGAGLASAGGTPDGSDVIHVDTGVGVVAASHVLIAGWTPAPGDPVLLFVSNSIPLGVLPLGGFPA